MEGYLLSQDHLTELQAVVRKEHSRQGRRPQRRRQPVFQPSAGGKVYQCVMGMRLKYGNADDPESKIFKEPAVLCVCLGDVGSESLRTFELSQVSQLRSMVVSAGVTDGYGIIVPELVDLLEQVSPIAALIEEQLGEPGGITLLRTRFATGYFGVGSLICGNDAEGFYGLGSQVFRARLGSEVPDTADKFYATLRPSGFDAEEIVVWDRGDSFESGDDVYVEFAQSVPFDGDAAENSEHWQPVSGDTLPIFEAIGSESTSSGTPNLAGVADDDASVGTASFTTTEGAKTATILGGLVRDGKSYTLVWTDDDHYVVADPETAVTGNSDQFFDTIDGDGDFTVGTMTINATISRGLCYNAKDYGLVWDTDHWAVVDPELTITGKPTALKLYGNSATVTIYKGTKGSETTISETASAWVRKGLAFSGRFYRCNWVDDSWELDDPTKEFDSVTSGALVTGDTPSIEVFIGTLGGEAGSGTSTTVRNSFGDIASGKRIRCAWCDWSDGWEIVNALC